MSIKQIALACLAGYTTLMIAASAAFAQMFSVSIRELNVRRTPDANAPVVFILRQGDRVEVVRRQGEWAYVIGATRGEGWVFGDYLTAMTPPSSGGSTNTNQIFQGTGTIDNARFQGSGKAQLVVVAGTGGASLNIGDAGRVSIEYIGIVQTNSGGTVNFRVDKFRSSKMGYRTVAASGTCNVQASAGAIRQAFCTAQGSGIDHGRTNFTAR